jgi:hypothetical protein
MTARGITWTNLKSWLIGVLLSTGAMFLGYDVGSEAAGLLGGEPALWARLGKGFVWGGIIAALQWPIVRAVGVPPVRFLLASAFGFAVGYPLGQTIQAIITLHWSLHWAGYWSAVATFGLSLGVPQWLIFRRHMRRAGLWVLYSMIGWLLTGLAWISFRAGDGLDAIVYGTVTGLGLVWLVHFQPPKTKVAES